jgi:hypothetical protein
MSRLSHRTDSWFTDGGVVSLTHRLPFTPQKYSGYSFLLEAESVTITLDYNSSHIELLLDNESLTVV